MVYLILSKLFSSDSERKISRSDISTKLSMYYCFSYGIVNYREGSTLTIES